MLLVRRLCLVLLATVAIGLRLLADGPVHVRSYVRSDGTVVRAHTRSLPGQGSHGQLGSGSAGSYGGGDVGTTETNHFARETDPAEVLAKNADEARGKATPASFAKLKIGQTAKEVHALLGKPSRATSTIWSYDGVGWLEFSASDRVTRIRPALAVPAPVESVRESSVTTGDQFLYADAPVRAGYPNSWTILTNIGYVSAYDDSFRNPAWVAYHLHGATPEAPDRPRSKYPMDPRTESKVEETDYPPKHDHGHMAPNYSISAFFGEAAQAETFLMSNMLPQRPRLNRGPWKSVETAEYKNWAEAGADLWIICGPVYTTAAGAPVNPTNRWGAKKICVPVACFKIVMRRQGGKLRTLAFIMPQEFPVGTKPAAFLTSIREVEKRTGLNFFSSLPQKEQDAIETEIAAALWP